MNNLRYFSLFLLLLLTYFLSAQVFIPDPNFEQALIDLGYDTDATINGQISNADALAVIFLNVPDKSISDLTGIDGFSNLSFLELDNNQLISLDVSNNAALTYLSCSNNQLTELEVSNNPILNTWLCQNNLLSDLDVSTLSALTNFQCFSNQLEGLDVSKNIALNFLFCGSNQLTELNVSNNTVLRALDCSFNRLTNLDITNNTDLSFLWCQENLLTSLDVRNGNNSLITSITATPFDASENPDLYCILVDDVAFANSNWTKDPQATFTNDPNDLACRPPPIPTLSQWGVLILGLMILIIGVVDVNDRMQSSLS